MTQTDRWECFRAFECGIVLIEKRGRGNEDLKGLASKTSSEKEAKKQALRLKNAKLRAAGKEPLKGWGKMVDTGIGGANKANPIDTKVFLGENQKRIADETKRNKQ